VQMIDLKYFFNISKDVAMATNLVAKMGQNYLPPALIALSIQNEMGYRLANTCIYSSNNSCTSCEKNGGNWLSSF